MGELCMFSAIEYWGGPKDGEAYFALTIPDDSDYYDSGIMRNHRRLLIWRNSGGSWS